MTVSRIERVAQRKVLGFSSELWAWAVYDLANTIFSALFLSLSFPVFIDSFAGGDEKLVGIVNSVACLASAAVVPFLGSISDRTGRRLPMLIVFTLMCCILTPLGSYRLSLPAASVFGGLAIFAYYTGLALYDAILPDLAGSTKQGQASGLGIGIGYGGTIIALLAAAPIQKVFGAESLLSLQVMNWMVGILFFIFALPLFILHKEKGSPIKIPWADVARQSWGRVMEGARLANKHLWLFMASQFFTVNAVMAVIMFFGLYAIKILEIPTATFVQIYALLAVSAMVWSIVGGFAVDKFGARPVLFFASFSWIAIILFMMQIQNVQGFVIAGVAGGAALGLVWTAARPLLIGLGDPERMGETFGFLGLANRASAVVGPLVFGIIASKYNYDWALGSLIAFFAVGIFFLMFVPTLRPEEAVETPAG